MRRRIALAALLAGASVLVACGSAATLPPAASPTSAHGIDPLPSANAFTSAVMATRSMGTADITVDVATTTRGATTVRRAAGAAVLSRGTGDLMWTADGRAMRELVNDQAIFTQADPPDGEWVRTTKDASTLTSGFSDVLRGVGVLHDVRPDGAEVLAGVATSRFAGWLPADSAELTGLGLTPDQVAAHLAAAADGRVVVTVWIDPFGHVVRVDRDVPPMGPDGTRVHSSTVLTDFSVLLDLTSPTDNVRDR